MEVSKTYPIPANPNDDPQFVANHITISSMYNRADTILGFFFLFLAANAEKTLECCVKYMHNISE